MPLPEAPARKKIDQLLLAADWHACNVGQATIHAALSSAIQFAHRIISKARLKRVPFTSIGIDQQYIVAEIEKRFLRLDEAELVEAASRCLSQRQHVAATYETGEELVQCILGYTHQNYVFRAGLFECELSTRLIW